MKVEIPQNCLSMVVEMEILYLYLIVTTQQYQIQIRTYYRYQNEHPTVFKVVKNSSILTTYNIKILLTHPFILYNTQLTQYIRI